MFENSRLDSCLLGLCVCVITVSRCLYVRSLTAYATGIWTLTAMYESVFLQTTM